MKHLYFLWVCASVFGQIQPKPETFSKIHFTYQTRLNYVVRSEGIYADTILYHTYFSNPKFTLARSPIDSSKTVGFIKKEDLSEDDRKNLVGQISALG